MISIQKLWCHIRYHVVPIPCATMISRKIHDIIHDIITKVWYHIQYHKNPLFYPFLAPSFYDITHDNIAEIIKKGYDIKISWYHRHLSHGIAYDVAWWVPVISRLSDIIALWYHLFLWYHVTCAASWCSEDRERLGPHGVLLRQSLTQSRARSLVPRAASWSEWWVSWQLLLKLPLQLETSQSQVQVEAPHWQWAWSQSHTRTAQVVMASFSQGHSQSVRSPGQGSQESGLDTWSHSVTGSSLSIIMAVASHASMSSCTSLNER